LREEEEEGAATAGGRRRRRRATRTNASSLSLVRLRQHSDAHALYERRKTTVTHEQERARTDERSSVKKSAGKRGLQRMAAVVHSDPTSVDGSSSFLSVQNSPLSTRASPAIVSKSIAVALACPLPEKTREERARRIVIEREENKTPSTIVFVSLFFAFL